MEFCEDQMILAIGSLAQMDIYISFSTCNIKPPFAIISNMKSDEIYNLFSASRIRDEIVVCYDLISILHVYCVLTLLTFRS